MASLTPRSTALVGIEFYAPPTWVSPADGSEISSLTPLVWDSVTSNKDAHFWVQRDTANTFSTGNMLNARSDIDNGFEYWDGSTWIPITSSGMPSNKTGNQVRFTPTAAVTGTWFRRVRQSA